MAESNNTQTNEESKELDEAKSAGSGRTVFLILIAIAIIIPASIGAYLTYTNYEHFAVLALAANTNVGTEHAKEEEEVVQYGQFMQLSDMIVNPTGSSGKRFLLVSLGLESHNPTTLEEIAAREIVVRDTILKVLGVRTVDELGDITRRDELKSELREAVNAIVHEGQVDRMYFTQFVLQ